MRDHSADPDRTGDGGSETTGAAQGMPRWVKVFVVLGVLLLLSVIVALLAGGEHGPGRHGPGMH
jgi:hypothetical protein